MAGKGITSSKDVTVYVVKRKLLPAAPGSAEPRHEYETILTTRASVKSRQGASEFASVDINGKSVTHTFTIRYSHKPIDVRCRVRTATGHLFAILSVENVDLGNRDMRLHCSNQGLETVEANQ
jgi:hypothetical protein